MNLAIRKIQYINLTLRFYFLYCFIYLLLPVILGSTDFIIFSCLVFLILSFFVNLSILLKNLIFVAVILLLILFMVNVGLTSRFIVKFSFVVVFLCSLKNYFLVSCIFYRFFLFFHLFNSLY